MVWMTTRIMRQVTCETVGTSASPSLESGWASRKSSQAISKGQSYHDHAFYFFLRHEQGSCQSCLRQCTWVPSSNHVVHLWCESRRFESEHIRSTNGSASARGKFQRLKHVSCWQSPGNTDVGFRIGVGQWSVPIQSMANGDSWRPRNNVHQLQIPNLLITTLPVMDLLPLPLRIRSKPIKRSVQLSRRISQMGHSDARRMVKAHSATPDHSTRCRRP